MSDDAIHDNSMNDNSMYDDLINDNLINDNLMHENVTRQEALREVPAGLFGRTLNAMQPDVDMNKIAGSHDILFICLDTLRYDVAAEEESKGTTPVLNRYGPWEKCQAPGNFTYPSHHAMFAGFLPCPYDAKSIADRQPLFFPVNAGMGKRAPAGAFGFSGATIMEGLEKAGYCLLYTSPSPRD